MKIDPPRQSLPTPRPSPRLRLRPEPTPTVAPLPGRSWRPVPPTADQWRARPRPHLHRRVAFDPLGRAWRQFARAARTIPPPRIPVSYPSPQTPIRQPRKRTRSVPPPAAPGIGINPAEVHPPEPSRLSSTASPFIPKSQPTPIAPPTQLTHPDPNPIVRAVQRRIELTPVAPPLPAILFTQDEPGTQLDPAIPTGRSSTPETVASATPIRFSQTLPAQEPAPVVWLTARDPFTVVAHWDRAPDRESAESAMDIEGHQPGGRWWMRLHADSAQGPVITERPASEIAGTTVMPVIESGRTYVAELGFESRRTGWHGVAISHRIQTPPEHREQTAPVAAATMAWAALTTEPGPGLPLGFVAAEPPPYTAEPTRWAWSWFVDGEPGTSKTLAGPEPDREERPEPPASPSLLESNPDNAPSSADSAGIPPNHPGRDFWMRIHAEVILHGSTDPHAAVTVAGHLIHLRPDGSFSFRFAFPNGQFSLPVIATAPDGLESRQAIVRFQRDTTLLGEVGEHPVPKTDDPTLPVTPGPG